jgi:HEAT repeat protein
MSVLAELATALGRRDEAPNIALAERLAHSGDPAAVAELVAHLGDRDKDVQADCIKTLYELGERRPSLLAGHWRALLDLLGSRNNRLVWGAMHALDTIALERPNELFAALPRILETAERGSVITRDHAVGILSRLSTFAAFADRTFPLLLGLLDEAPSNQLPSYAEKAGEVVRSVDVPRLRAALERRLPSIAQESKRRRVEKVLRRLAK